MSMAFFRRARIATVRCCHNFHPVQCVRQEGRRDCKKIAPTIPDGSALEWSGQLKWPIKQQPKSKK